MKAFNLALLTTLLFNFACGVEETVDTQENPEINFNLSDSEGFALRAGVVFTEQCFFSEGVSEILVLTPWALDCDGAQIDTAPENWKAITIALDDGCGNSDVMKTAEQSTELLADGTQESSYSHGHTHDVRNTLREDITLEDGTKKVSLEFDILPMFQSNSDNVIGQLSANLVHCGARESEDFRDWWQPASSF